MTVEIKYNFDTPSDYTFDSSVIEVTGGVARLKLANNPDQTFTQDFSSDNGFTYDSDLIEFASGRVEQKNQIESDEKYGATWSTTINASWGSVASLVPTATQDNPQISGGKLDLVPNKYVIYNVQGAINPSVGAIRLKVTPNWNGTPSGNQQLFYYTVSGTANNRLYLDVSSSGALRLYIHTSTGGSSVTASYGNWNDAIQGQEYEIEVNYDFRSGQEAQRLFIDGIQRSGASTVVSSRSDNLTENIVYRQGGTANADYAVRDLIIYDTVQHTADYTPGYSVPENVYVEASAILPTFNYSGQGSIQVYQSLANTAFGNGKYILNGKYHDGGDWVNSNGSYAQSNSITEINTNLGSAQVSNSIIMTLVFPDSATQNYVSNFVFTYTGQHYVSGSTIKPNTHIPVTDVSEFVEEAVIPANTNIKYTIELNAVEYWWNGGSWQPSNGTLSESNTASDVNANVSELPIQETGDFVLPKIYFETDGSDRSELQSLCLKVSYDVNPVDKPDSTILFGSLIDMVPENMTGTATLRVVTDTQFFINGNSVQPSTVERVANNEGIAAVTVVKTASIDYKYSFYIDYFDSKGKKKTVNLGKSIAPDDTASNIANLTFESS